MCVSVATQVGGVGWQVPPEHLVFVLSPYEYVFHLVRGKTLACPQVPRQHLRARSASARAVRAPPPAHRRSTSRAQPQQQLDRRRATVSRQPLTHRLAVASSDRRVSASSR